MSEFDKTFTSLSFFVESPDYFEGGIFHTEMNDVKRNKLTYKRLFPKLEKIKHFKTFEVYKKPHDFFGEENLTFYLIKDNIIEGAFEFETRKNNNFCLGVWQRNVAENKGLARQFVFEYLPKIYNSIVSGKTANKYGFNFWKKLMNQALSKNLKVTVLEGSPNNESVYNSTQFKNYWTRIVKDKKTDPSLISGSDRLFKIYF